MAELKPGWKRVKFRELAECINDRIDDPSTAGVERYVGLDHLDPESLTIRRWGSPEDVESTKLRFKAGDIIFGKRRAYQRKLAVADFEGICSAHAMVLRVRPGVVLPEFLPFFMQSDLFMKRAVEISVGSLSPTISWKTLAQQEFALPPADEQRRAAKLLRAATLVIEATTDLEASVKLAHSSAVDKLVENAFRAWPTRNLDDMIEPGRPITYGILKPGIGHPDGVPVIKVKDYPEGEVVAGNLLLTDPRIDEEYRRSRLRAGDLLISIRGTVGRLAFVPNELENANITQDTARLSIRDEVSPAFVRCLLESSHLLGQIRKNTIGLAVQGINIGDLRKLKMPLPPVPEQQKIAEIWQASRNSVALASARRLGSRACFSRLMSIALECS